VTGSDEGADLPDILLPELPDSPYPGLRPFEKREWPIFFGRERMTDEVVERLLRRRLVIVHGASGSGKSSLVRAGVQARLEQQHSRSELRWRTCAMRPGRSPLGNLAEALAGVGDGLRGPPTIEIRRALNRGRRAPEAIRALLRISEADRVCILLDQFEELFRFADEVSRDEASLLTDFLAAFQEAPPVGMYLLVTMRSEFLGECAGFDGLAETVNHTQYLLPRMETQDLLRAVREPAELYDGRVSERLAERLIADARAGQDELPLIQHGLLRLWVFSADPGGGKPRRALDLPEYETRGPLSRLLSDHADGVVDEAAEDAAGQTQIEELFRALTDTNAAGQATRRPQRFGDLVPVTGSSRDRLRSILIDLREPGVSFITPFPPAPIGEDTTIDISHEALIRRWERIASPNDGWLQQEFRDGLIWRALVVQADSFAADPRNVLSEATTEARTEWIKGRNAAWAERYGGRWALVGELLIASQKDIERRREQAARERERAEELKLAQERRAAAESLLAERDKRIAAEQELALRRGRQLRIALITAVVTLGLALVAGWEWRTAEMLRGIAQQQAVIASTQRAMADEAAAAANKLAR